jgi:hypothetical protein
MSEKDVTNYEGNERFESANEEILLRRPSSDDSTGITMRINRPRHQRPHVANPDDPPIHRPPQGPKGPLPGPNYLGLEGRNAIVQGQVLIVAIILIVQLWLITDALYELLSGRLSNLGWLALASGLGFVLAIVVSFWPRRRIEES